MLLTWIFANKNIALYGLIVASLLGSHYYVYRSGRAYERNLQTISENNKLIAFVNEQKKIYDSLNSFKDEVNKDAQTSDRPASDFIVRNVNRLPLPIKPPRKP